MPADFDVDDYRGRPGLAARRPSPATARIEVDGRHGLVGPPHAAATPARSTDGVFETEYASIEPLAAGCCARTAAPSRSSRRSCAPPAPKGCAASAAAHEAEPPKLAREKAVAAAADGAERARSAGAPRSGSPSCRRCSPTCSRACGDEREAHLDADELAERFHIPRDELQEHLSLLNLVNFGGGCYTVYAELDGDTVRVDKELYGDVFRLAPRLTPLEARAIRLALDIVGPSIAAQVHTPLDRVRKKLEETFGQFEDHQTPEPRGASDEEELVATLAARRSSSDASSRSTT